MALRCRLTGGPARALIWRRLANSIHRDRDVWDGWDSDGFGAFDVAHRAPLTTLTTFTLFVRCARNQQPATTERPELDEARHKLSNYNVTTVLKS